MIRMLIRLAVLALAAVGAKTLYDKLAPRTDELKSTGSQLLDRTSTAAREVGAKATEATQRIAATAQDSAAAVKATAVEQANEVASEVKAAAQEAKTGQHDTNGNQTAPSATGGSSASR